MGIILTTTGLPLLTSRGLLAAPAALAASPISPVPVPKPEAGAVALQGPTLSIAYRGVTWSFSSPVFWYASANGDPVVISHADHLPSGTTITAISPRSAASSGGHKTNGAMRNPVLPEPVAGGQGFDGVLGTNLVSATLNHAYNDSLNEDPGSTGSPIPINPGDAFTIVKAVRIPSGGDTAYKPIEKYVPLTIMNTLPPKAGTWFRPSISARTKTWPGCVEDVNWSALRDLPAPSGLSAPSVYLAEIEAQNLRTIPAWMSTAETARRSQINAETPGNGYSRDYGRRRGQYACSLHIDPAGSVAAIEARRALAIILAQWGIDIDGAYQEGLVQGDGAGQWFGVIEFHYLAAFLLGDAGMLDRARRLRSNTINQCFWVSDREINYPIDTDTGSMGSNMKTMREKYLRDVDLGRPEWTHSGWGASGYRPEALQVNIPLVNAAIYTPYRDSFFTTQIYELLPIALLRNGFGTGMTGDEAIRDGAAGPGNIRSAAIAYMDRSMTFLPAPANLGHDTDSQLAYKAWRSHVPQARWVGRPDVLTHTDFPQFTVDRAGPGEVDFSCLGVEFATGTVRDRQLSWSQDGMQFVPPVSIGTKATHILTGLRPGTPHWCRWRQVNEHGEGRWSSTWEMNAADGNVAAKYKEDRGLVTTPGTPGGTLTNTVPPAILCKPHEGFWMPYYEPVTDATGKSVFYAGMGYWTGGTGTLTPSYQWQRNDGAGGAWRTIATGQSYPRQRADSGYRLRCVVTVNGVAAVSNEIGVPARRISPALIDIDFDGEAPFDWPDFWAELVAEDISTTSWTMHHFPTAQMRADWTPGTVWFQKTGPHPVQDIVLTNSAAAGTYNYRIQAGLGAFVGGAITGSTTFRFLDGAGKVIGTATHTKTAADGPFEETFAGTFTATAGQVVRFQLWVQNSTGFGGNHAGGPYLGKLQVWKAS